MASPSWRVVDPDTCLPYVWVLPPIRWKSSWARQGHTPTDPAVPPLSLLKEVSIGVTDYGQRALASCPPGSSVPPSTPGGVIRRRTTDNGDTLRVTDRDPNEASISGLIHGRRAHPEVSSRRAHQ